MKTRARRLFLSEVARRDQELTFRELAKVLDGGVFHLKAVCRATGINRSTIDYMRRNRRCSLATLDRLIVYFREMAKGFP